MSHRDAGGGVSFSPLRPASRARLIVVALVSPILWVIAVLIAAVVVDRSNAVELGALVAIASVVVAAAVLVVLRRARDREERRYAERR